MAKDVKAESGDAPKKSGKLLIIVVAAVLLLVAGGGAAFFLLTKDSDAEEDEVAVEKEKPKKKKAGKEAPPAFAKLDTFTVNLQRENGDQYLQVAIELEVEDISLVEKLKAFTPKIRARILDILSEKKPSELTSKGGKNELAELIKADINEVLEGPAVKGKADDGPVKAVLFTQFIIQ